MKKILFLFLSIAAFSITAFADIRLPDTAKTTSKSDKKEKRISFNIRVNSNVKEPVLRLTRGTAKDLRAQLDELEGIDETNHAAGFNISRTQTLMSGLFLSAAFIFGGVWAFRGKSFGKNQKIVSGFVIFALLGVSVLTIFGNVAPPPLKGIDSTLFSDKLKSRWQGAVGTVKLEITESESSNGSMTLIIPRAEDSAAAE